MRGRINTDTTPSVVKHWVTEPPLEAGVKRVQDSEQGDVSISAADPVRERFHQGVPSGRLFA
jgi:hypothetical protein